MDLSDFHGPKSKCTCGHTDIEHGSKLTTDYRVVSSHHGGCLVDGCNCQQFTWAGFTKEFETYLNEVRNNG